MTKELGEHVDLWATLNEPTAYILKSYIQGDWCPGKKDLKETLLVYKNLIAAHNQAYVQMKKTDKNATVGIVANMAAYKPAEQSLLNKEITLIAKSFSNDLFTHFIINKCDFLGIDYYMQFTIGHIQPFAQKDKSRISDYG